MNARLSASRRTGTTRGARLASSGEGPAVVVAAAADHPAVRYFLAEVFHGPSSHEFKASIEDPFHEPHDRLLLKQADQIVGHVLTTRRVLHFGPLRLAVGFLHQLGILPELRGHGEGQRLAQMAEHHMAACDAWIGLLRTTVPDFFQRAGWTRCPETPSWQAPTRAVLSEMFESDLPTTPRHGRQLQVRGWRRLELPALLRIYDQTQSESHGPLERTEAYWRWLLQRHAFDQLYIALEGPPVLELEEIETAVVGYAAVRGPRILELQSAPDCPEARTELLRRICGDAIELDRHWITLHSPSGDPLHRLFDLAGGRQGRPESDRGGLLMVRILSPLRLLRHLSSQWPELAASAGLPLPLELGLAVDRHRYFIKLGPQGVAVTSGKLGPDHLRMTESDFPRLVLGQLDWSIVLAAGQVIASTPLAETAGRVLFPSVSLWCPPWDEALA
ncbi:MAG: GNAT family N-acetyltransferase [Pirellulales bacterium]|nr:GNAT family N-acetyltransferase [Pirellulales bacterium]